MTNGGRGGVAVLGFMTAALIAGCGSSGGTGNGASPPGSSGRAGGEDRQVLVDLKKRACTERLDLRPNFETERARQGCDCAVDRLLEGKSADEIMEVMGSNEQSALEERTADQCLAEGR